MSLQQNEIRLNIKNNVLLVGLQIGKMVFGLKVVKFLLFIFNFIFAVSVTLNFFCSNKQSSF